MAQQLLSAWVKKVMAEDHLGSHELDDPSTLRKSDNLSRPKIKKIIKESNSSMGDGMQLVPEMHVLANCFLGWVEIPQRC